MKKILSKRHNRQGIIEATFVVPRKPPFPNKFLKRGLYSVLILFFIGMPAARSQVKDYRNDSLEVTDAVEEFVVRHNIFGSEMEMIQKIIELIHDEFLFVRIDRRRMESWIQSPGEAEEYRSHLKWLRESLEQIDSLRKFWPLSRDESLMRDDLQEALFFGEHDLAVFDSVIKKKDIYPRDLPFAVSGAEAVEFGISDGCTTATKTFIVLAKAAGIREIRFVTTGCTSNYNTACPSTNIPRKEGVTINGHFFALVKIQDKWALVNCTYYNPYGADESSRFEIFFELEGAPLSPEALVPMTLKIPSFQKEDLCQKSLYVIGIGGHAEDDMDIENYDALMNLSVCGDRNCRICRYPQF